MAFIILTVIFLNFPTCSQKKRACNFLRNWIFDMQSSCLFILLIPPLLEFENSEAKIKPYVAAVTKLVKFIHNSWRKHKRNISLFTIKSDKDLVLINLYRLQVWFF